MNLRSNFRPFIRNPQTLEREREREREGNLGGFAAQSLEKLLPCPNEFDLNSLSSILCMFLLSIFVSI
jgi:hypothetical protein